MNPDPRYVYADGNGNKYVITCDKLEYDPVTPAESSSGIYSGGEPKTVSITSSQFELIVQLFDKAIANKSAQIKDRVKGSGVISNRGASTEVLLTPGSAEMQQIESLLRKTLKTN